MSNTEIFNGTWEIGKIPEDFIKVLKVLGYSRFERKWFQNTRTHIKSTLEGDLLTLEIKGRGHHKVKEYTLNNQPIEYNDVDGNPLMEISKKLNENTVQIKTLFLNQNVTMIDTREVLENGDCRYHVRLMHADDDAPIEVEMVLARHHHHHAHHHKDQEQEEESKPTDQPAESDDDSGSCTSSDDESAGESDEDDHDNE